MSYKDKLIVMDVVDPPRILIYGDAGVGKTSLAAQFPKPLFLMIEDGKNDTTERLKIEGWDRRVIENYSDVYNILQEIYNDDYPHQTLVIDSLSALEAMIHDEVLLRPDEKGNMHDRIGDFPYGAGYGYALDVWNQFLQCVEMIRISKRMTIVFVAHSNIVKFDDPQTSSYSRYEIKLQNSEKISARKLVEGTMDAVLLLKKDVSAKKEPSKGKVEGRAIPESANTFIHAAQNAAFVAKSRYGIPSKTVFREGQGYAVLAPYLPAQPDAAMKNKE
jgi:hypothetical protein